MKVDVLTGSCGEKTVIDIGPAPALVLVFELEGRTPARAILPGDWDSMRRIFGGLSPAMRYWVLCLDVWTDNERDELAALIEEE